MATHKEQLKLYQEQRTALIDQIKKMRSDLQKEQRKTTHFRKQRDRYKSERQTLIAKAVPEIESRDSQKDMVENLKKRRDFLRRQSDQINGPVFKILTATQLEKLTIVELRYHLYELEFKQQTSSLSKEDEEILIDEIQRVEDRIDLLQKKNEALVADYLGEIPETKEKIEQEIAKIEQQITQEETDRKEITEKVSAMYTRIRPLKEEEDKAHENFIKHLQKVEELKAEIDAKQEELDSLKAKLANIRKLIAEESRKKIYGKIEEKIQSLLEKRDKGESLTVEEQEFLMSHGYVPF